MIDTVGWTPASNYKSIEFGNMLKGRVKKHSTLAQSVSTTPDVHYPIDAVYFVLDTSVKGQEISTLKDLKPFILEAIKCNLYICFLVTKVDTLQGMMSALQMENCKEWMEIKGALFSELNSWPEFKGKPLIFPIANYNNMSTIRNPEIEQYMKNVLNDFAGVLLSTLQQQEMEEDIFEGETEIKFA